MDLPESLPLPLRPLNLNDIIQAAVTLVLSHAGVILGVLLLTNLPLLLWQALAIVAPGGWTVPPRYRSAQDLPAMLTLAVGIADGRADLRLVIGALAGLLAAMAQSAVLIPLLAAWHQQRPLTLVAAFEDALARLPRLAVVYLPPALLVILLGSMYGRSTPATALTAAILLAIYPFWLFITHSVMIEDRSIFDALERGASLVRTRYWRVFGTWLMIELLLLIVSAIPVFVIGLASVAMTHNQRFELLTVATGALAIVLIEPFRDAATTLLYLELRRRRREFAVQPAERVSR